jgi:hypothetical protein
MTCIVVIDFETTSLSRAIGDRATKIAIVMRPPHLCPHARTWRWPEVDQPLGLCRTIGP